MKRSDVPERAVLEAALAFHERHGPTPDKVLADRFPEKLVLARMEQLVNRGLLEYGVSTRTAWLTETGRQRLKELTR